MWAKRFYAKMRTMCGAQCRGSNYVASYGPTKSVILVQFSVKFLGRMLEMITVNLNLKFNGRKTLINLKRSNSNLENALEEILTRVICNIKSLLYMFLSFYQYDSYVL